ncbi:MAG: tetratricopeptide repeat protein, partial [Anaerolineae bacterium]
MGRSSDRPISAVAIPGEAVSPPALAPFAGLLVEPLALDEEGFQELERLCTALASLRGHPALFLAFCDSPLLRDRLIAEIAARLPDWSIQVFRVREAGQDFLPWLAAVETAAGDAVFVIVDPETVPPVARYLNYRREILARLPYPLLLWFPHDTEKEVHRLAPDFWAFRRQVFTFRLFAPWLLSVSQKVAETGIPTGTPEDRQAGISLLRQLLSDLQETGAGNTVLAARLHRELGDLLRQENLWEESRRELEQALTIAEGEGFPEAERAPIYYSLGLTRYHLDEYDAALESYGAALAHFRA